MSHKTYIAQCEENDGETAPSIDYFKIFRLIWHCLVPYYNTFLIMAIIIAIIIICALYHLQPLVI